MRYLVVVALLTLAACNTISGFGKDLKSAGGAIEDTAK
jgi:predicted small secreted protein